MTKHQTREIQNVRAHLAIGNTHAAAAGLSALIRAAMRKTDAAELRAIAAQLKLDAHPAFIA